MSANGRELANYFYGKTGCKCASQKMFFGAVSSGDALIKAGWTKDEVKQVIDYLVAHPPANGLYKLAFLQYVMDETIAKIHAEETKKQMESMPTAPTTVSADDDNRRKYEEQSKPVTSKLFNI